MNKWKVTAIIFIILFVLETGVLIWAWKVGTQTIDNENECSYNICSDYPSYFYDSYTKICYCYEDGLVVHQEYIK